MRRKFSWDKMFIFAYFFKPSDIGIYLGLNNAYMKGYWYCTIFVACKMTSILYWSTAYAIGYMRTLEMKINGNFRYITWYSFLLVLWVKLYHLINEWFLLVKLLPKFIYWYLWHHFDNLVPDLAPYCQNGAKYNNI